VSTTTLDRRRRLAAARLYLVCGELPDGRLAALLEAGVDIVQLRLKEADDELVLAVARRMGAVCRRHGKLFIVNDRPDLAAAAQADGVHVGQDDTPLAAARAQVGGERLLGLSTHTPRQVDACGEADYIGVGPVHATPTKPGRAAVGLELVRYAATRARVPFFAIGGITPENVTQVRAAGARGVAVVRALTQAAEPAQNARALRRILDDEEAHLDAAQS
jgi:thiamine-phosphate pyrophosphorylase